MDISKNISCEEVVILDFETTGLTPKVNRVIEVAAAITKNKKIIKTFTQLMNPGQYIPPFITSLTGITNEMVADKPSPEKVMPKLKEFIGNRLIVAHNANFDRKFLYAEMERANIFINNPVMCTLLLSRRLIPNVYNYKLSTLAEHLNIDATRAHRALSDVQVTAKLWSYLYTQVGQLSGIKQPDFSLLTAISKRPLAVIERSWRT